MKTEINVGIFFGGIPEGFRQELFREQRKKYLSVSDDIERQRAGAVSNGVGALHPQRGFFKDASDHIDETGNQWLGIRRIRSVRRVPFGRFG